MVNRWLGFRFGRFLLAATLFVTISFSGASVAQAEEALCSSAAYRDLYACREVIVKYLADFDPVGVSARYSLQLIGLIPQLTQAWFLAPIGTDYDALASSLRAEQGVFGVEHNSEFILPECRQLNIPILDLGPRTGADLSRQSAMAAMRRPLSDALGTGVVVAVLDTGVSRRHPALAGALLPLGIDVLGHDPLADDVGDGIDENLNGVTDEGHGHGTAIASLIHAVAPQAKLLPVRVIDDECNGSAFALASGIVRAVDAGAHILNLSLGAKEDNDAVESALAYALARGVVVVAAAGNQLRPSAAPEDEIQFPASWDRSISVAAVTDVLEATSFTLFDEHVQLSAPGVELLTAWRDDSYARASGTSFSTALVSGAAAVARQIEPSFTPAEILSWMRQTALAVDPWNAPWLGGQLGAGVPDLTALTALVERPRGSSGPLTRHAEDDTEVATTPTSGPGPVLSTESD